MKDRTIFWVIVFLALAALFIVHPFTLINGDEGIYVQYASLLESGKIPIADYEARTPILLFLINFFTIIFGPSILVFRLPVIITTALSAGFLFLLGKELFSRKVGAIAGFLYGLNPYVLWSDSVIKSEMLTILFTILSALFLAKALKRQNWYWYSLSGLWAGLALLERHSGAAFFFASACIVIARAYQKTDLTLLQKAREVFKKGLFITTGVLVGFLPGFLWIASRDLSRALEFWFGISARILGLSIPNSLATSFGVLSYPVFREWGLTLVEDMAVQAWVLFVGLFIFILVGIQVLFKKSLLRTVSFFLVLILFGGAFMEHSLGVFFTQGNFHPFVFLSALLLSVPLFFVVYIRFVQNELIALHIRQYCQQILFLVFWFLGLVIIYSFWNPSYLREFIAPAALVSALIVSAVPFASFKRYEKIVVLVSIVGLYGTSLAWFTNPFTGGWLWRQETMNSTAEYIKIHTQPQEEVFSANPLPLMLADRRVFRDISSYSIISVARADEKWGTYPSPAELLAQLKAQPPRYAIIDERMKKHIFTPFPVFRDFVVEEYKQVASYGEKKDRTEIWQRKK
jgi:4-amino-4-deoxy-L-arabinose transferase-like glycosyltransferase